jgi:hypothetical protein
MTKHHFVSLTAIAAAVLLNNVTCHASIVFNNGNHILTGRLASNGNQAADDFLLPTTTTITDVHWKGFYAPGVATTPDNFTINFYNDDGTGLQPTPPGTAIYSATVGAVSRIATGEISLGSFTVYEYSTFIPSFIATGGVKYWLEIFNNATPPNWYWSMDQSLGNGVETHFSTVWMPTGDEFTFQLTDDGTTPAAPEASSLAIWAIVTSLGLFVRKRTSPKGTEFIS